MRSEKEKVKGNGENNLMRKRKKEMTIEKEKLDFI